MSVVKHYKNNKGQVIGKLHDDMAFRKEVIKSRHLLKIMDAWGIDKKVIDELQERGCKQIRIREKTSGDVYYMSLSKFLENAVKRDFDTPQLFVSRKFFNTITSD